MKSIFLNQWASLTVMLIGSFLFFTKLMSQDTLLLLMITFIFIRLFFDKKSTRTNVTSLDNYLTGINEMIQENNTDAVKALIKCGLNDHPNNSELLKYQKDWN